MKKISYIRNEANGGKGSALNEAFQLLQTICELLRCRFGEYDPVDLKELKRLSMQHPNS